MSLNGSPPRRRTVALRVTAASVFAGLGVGALLPGVRNTVIDQFSSGVPTPAAIGPARLPTLVGQEGAVGASSSYVRIAAAGDVGTGDSEEYETAAAIDRLEGADEYDALLLLGDNSYPDGDPRFLDETVFDPFADVLDGGTRLLPVLGDRDVDLEFGDAQVETLGMPGRWYSTLIDDVLIVSLDSTQPENEDQLAWLTAELAWSPARWTIVELHHPPYSAGFHGSSTRVRDAFNPLFEEYNVQLVLSGHDHDYQRSRVINGVTYIVSGGAAQLSTASVAGFTEVAFSEYHFTDITVLADRIEVQAVDQTGHVLDAVTILGPHETYGGA